MSNRMLAAKITLVGLFLTAIAVWGVAAHGGGKLASSNDESSRARKDSGDDVSGGKHVEPIKAEVVATGIPGAGAILQVGTFQAGGPFHDNSSFALYTQPGAVLNHDRVLVASTSNFGAPLARAADAPGSVISLDISNGPVAVPAGFAGVFSFQFGTAEAVGPLFNGQSCSSCHNSPSAGGMGAGAETFVTRVARTRDGQFDSMDGHGGPVARRLSVNSLGEQCGLPTGVPAQATLTSRRSAMTLEGSSLLDFVAEGDILKVQAAQPEAVRGRQNILTDGRAGRFGWKAQTATLVEFMGEALRDEMGVKNPVRVQDLPEVVMSGADCGKPNSD
jgi:Di-haem oxidoreductase, putative peroxidase